MVRRRTNSRPSSNRSTSKPPARSTAPKSQGAATQRAQQSGGSKPAGAPSQQNAGARPQQQASNQNQQATTAARPQQAAQQASQQATTAPAARPNATPQDQVNVSAEAKEGAAKPGESSGVTGMMNKFGDWAKGQYESAKGVVKEGVQTAKDIAEFGPTMLDIKQNGITPKNADKVNELLSKIDTPEAASKFLKEHPFMADKLRGLGEDKLNAMFNKTGQNMQDTGTLYHMLGENKLGGKDGRVTTGDVGAITGAVMGDRGMRGMFMDAAANQMYKTGHPLAGRIMDRGGFIANNQLDKRGYGIVSGQLNGALNKMGLQGPQDNARRQLSYGELNNMVQAGQRLTGNSQPQSLNSMVQQGVWNPQPSPTMAGLQNQAHQGINKAGLKQDGMAQDILHKTVDSMPEWLQGNQREGVRKYWEANMHVHNLLQSIGVDGK